MAAIYNVSMSEREKGVYHSNISEVLCILYVLHFYETNAVVILLKASRFIILHNIILCDTRSASVDSACDPDIYDAADFSVFIYLLYL